MALAVLPFSLAAALGAGIAASPAPPETPLAAMVRTEREFARQAGQDGWVKAFLAYFTEDAVLLSPAPTRAREGLLAQVETKPTATLDWHPEWSALSLDGTLGINTGPSTYTEPGKAPHHGYFFSIWKKQVDGRFKVILDVGVDMPGPDAGAPAWSAARPTGFGSATSGTGTLPAAETALGRGIAAKGWAAGYAPHLETEAWLLRSGVTPFRGEPAARRYLESISGAGDVAFEREHSGVAPSDDLGYTYGRCTRSVAAPPAAERIVTGYYVHVWRRNRDGEWKLLADVLKPPAKTP